MMILRYSRYWRWRRSDEAVGQLSPGKTPRSRKPRDLGHPAKPPGLETARPGAPGKTPRSRNRETWGTRITTVGRREIMKIIVLVLLSSLAVCQAQMAPDPKADTTVPNPAYKTSHPKLAIDQAHGNIHTKDGLFQPFAQLAANDGYQVVANTNDFTKDSLKGIDVLV